MTITPVSVEFVQGGGGRIDQDLIFSEPPFVDLGVLVLPFIGDELRLPLPTGGGGGGGGSDGTVTDVRLTLTDTELTIAVDRMGARTLQHTVDLAGILPDITGLATTARVDTLEGSLREADTALQNQITTNERSIETHTTEIAGNATLITAVGDPQRVLVMNADNYITALRAQFASNRPLVFVIAADVSGMFTHPSTGVTSPFEYDAGDVIWVPPLSVDPKDLFNIPPAGSGSGGEGVDTAARTRLTAIEADDWVTTRRYADQSIETNHILWGSLIGRHFRTIANGGGIGGGLIVNNALEDRHFPNDIISSRMIPADAVGNSELQADSVGAEEVINGSLTEVTLAAAVRAKLNASRGSDPVILVEDPASPETATADNFNKLLWRGDRLYYNSRSRTDGTNVGWGPMTTPLLVQHVGAGLAWQGAHQINPQESTLAVGDVIYSIPTQRFLVVRTVVSNLRYRPLNVPGWIGAQSDEAEADSHATAFGDVSFFDGGVQVVTSFSMTTRYDYHWELYEHDLNTRLQGIEANGWVTEQRLATAVRTKLNAPPTRILRPVSQFVRNSQAQTVYVQWVPGVVVASGAALTVSVEGTNITGVTAPEGLAAGDTQGSVLAIAITAANAGTIARSSDAIAGHVEIQVTHNSVTDSCFMGTLSAGPTPRVRITQAAYDALVSKDANTLYLVPE